MRAFRLTNGNDTNSGAIDGVKLFIKIFGGYFSWERLKKGLVLSHYYPHFPVTFMLRLYKSILLFF